MQSEQLTEYSQQGVFIPVTTIHEIRNSLQVIAASSETNREHGSEVRQQVNRINNLLTLAIRRKV